MTDTERGRYLRLIQVNAESCEDEIALRRALAELSPVKSQQRILNRMVGRKATEEELLELGRLEPLIAAWRRR